MTEEPPEIGADEPEEEIETSGLASVILIDRREDLAAICGRVDTAPTFAVVVHAPNGNRPLTSELGMRRLQRHAEETGKVVAIATGATALAARARQVGVPVARKPEHVRWDAAGRRVVRVVGHSVVVPTLGRYLQAIVLLALAAGFITLAATLAPSATVSVAPPVETLARSVTITASSDRQEIDFANLLVPARKVSAHQRITLAVPTTGRVAVDTASALVQVTITNPTASEVAVAARAVLITSPDGPLFEIDQDAVVPGGKTVTLQATAVKPGPEGNVAAAAVSGFQDARYRALKATNAAAATGGASEERPAVDANDIVAVRKLANELGQSESIRRTLLAARPHDAVFLRTAEVETDIGQPSAAAGTPADLLLLPVDVTVTAYAVGADVLEAVARRVLFPDESSGEFIPGSVTAVETGARQASAEDSVIRTEIQVTGDFARNVTRAAVKDAVKGRSPDAARSTLASRYGIQDAEVRVSPGWAPWLPRFGFRISVELRSQQSGATATPTGPQTDATASQPSAAGTPAPGR